MQQSYPAAFSLLSKNNDAMKAINKSEIGFTVFAPNDEAFEALGDKKQGQLGDVRNEEVAEKIAGYHVIAEPVTDKMLFNSGGVITLAGEVPCERSTSGGIFGMGGKEDGGVRWMEARLSKQRSSLRMISFVLYMKLMGLFRRVSYGVMQTSYVFQDPSDTWWECVL